MLGNPLVMNLSQEVLCEIFNYLQDHPVHFTRVSQVSRSWNFAANNHLFWRRLVKDVNLPVPKKKAYKYRTHKSIIIKHWGSFCTLCDARRKREIQPKIVDMTRVAKINFKTSSWFRVVLKNPITQGQVEESAQFFNHLICLRCNIIYTSYISEENIRSRRELLSTKLEELGLTFPPNSSTARNLCDEFVLFGEGCPTNIARKLALFGNEFNDEQIFLI